MGRAILPAAGFQPAEACATSQASNIRFTIACAATGRRAIYSAEIANHRQIDVLHIKLRVQDSRSIRRDAKIRPEMVHAARDGGDLGLVPRRRIVEVDRLGRVSGVGHES